MEAFLLNMEKSQMDIMERAKTSRSLNRYVSVFRIDGEPILPPLMTAEKRKQMQKYKEKAIRLEKRFKEKLRLRQDSDVIDDQMSETSRSSINNPSTIIDKQQDLYDFRNAESEEPLLILQNILQSHCQDTSSKLVAGVPPIDTSSSGDMKQKLLKLQKSETLMFDNLNLDNVINEESGDQNVNNSDAQRWLSELERNANLNYVQPKKFSAFYLTKNKTKGIPIIPTIHINSPTIALSPRSRHTSSSETESNESLIISDTRRNIVGYKNISSDESFNNLIENTHNQAKRESLRKLKNTLDIASKIQKFESINNDNSSMNSSKIQSTTTTTPHASPEKDVTDHKRHKPLEAYVGNMSRSATSPSLKHTSHHLEARPQTSPEREPLQDEATNLVRSTSFILEGPSKVLIEHMRQQNSIYNKSLNVSANATSSTSMSKTFSSRITKDTIESKAKKVQKVDLKPSRTKIQQKPSFTRISGAASSSYNSFSGINGGKQKHKRSPYDAVNPSGKQHGLSSSSKLSNLQSRKSLSLNSSTTTFKVVKGSNTASLAAKQQHATTHSDQITTEKQHCPQKLLSNSQNDLLATMDEKHKAQFLKLLAQQDEEKRKLQKTFEQQQKLLYDKLTNELALPQMQTLHTARDKGIHNSSNQMYSECNTNQPKSIALTAKESLMSISGNNIAIHSSLYANHNSRNVDSGLIEYDNNCNVAAYIPDTSSSSARRRLYLQENTFVKEGQHQNHISRSISKLRTNKDCHKSGSCSNERRVSFKSTVVRGNEDDERYHLAGTVINAYARGYLTRRLLRSQEVQGIIRTIHDTLIFVINLHVETCEDTYEANDPANIKLKARLLQQLSSASYRLHTICFDISIKERMEIIQRDRKYIQTKLLAMNRNR